MSLKPLIFPRASRERASPRRSVEIIETSGVTVFEAERAHDPDEPVPFASTLPRLSPDLVSGRATKTA